MAITPVSIIIGVLTLGVELDASNSTQVYYIRRRITLAVVTSGPKGKHNKMVMMIIHHASTKLQLYFKFSQHLQTRTFPMFPLYTYRKKNGGQVFKGINNSLNFIYFTTITKQSDYYIILMAHIGANGWSLLW